MNILIMGPAASGKGTMSSRILEKFTIPHISTGDMFRQAIQEGSALGRIAATFINEGHLVPDEMTIAMISERLKQADCQQGYLMDGYPRTMAQVEAFEKCAAEIGKPVQIVINLVVGIDEIAARVLGRQICSQCGAVYHKTNQPSKVSGVCDVCDGQLYHRSDDTLEQLQVRLDEHRKNFDPILAHYRALGLVADIDGAQPIEAVWQDIQHALENAA